MKSLRPIAERICCICGYQGFFGIAGSPPRIDIRCPKCYSKERHRLLWLALERNLIADEIAVDDKVIHFAPEQGLEKRLRERWNNYSTADIKQTADLILNIEDINLPDSSVKLVIANHVLEHVDDLRSASEISRILRKDGLLICMVPIIEGWDTTYENEDIDTKHGRLLHFGQKDHVRFYGRDFKDRIERGGLKLEREVTAKGEDVVKYALRRGEKVFVFSKG